jgi:hypothetical protein
MRGVIPLRAWILWRDCEQSSHVDHPIGCRLNAIYQPTEGSQWPNRRCGTLTRWAARTSRC